VTLLIVSAVLVAAVLIPGCPNDASLCPPRGPGPLPQWAFFFGEKKKKKKAALLRKFAPAQGDRLHRVDPTRNSAAVLRVPGYGARSEKINKRRSGADCPEKPGGFGRKKGSVAGVTEKLPRAKVG